jgi:hypothetical protein
MEVQLAQQRLDREVLIGRELLIAKPAAALDPEQIREGAASTRLR